jgi:hypothetical protein
MPTRDLSVLSRAFGASRNRPTDATLPYVGQADERRDEALQAYRAGDETALEGTFNRQQEADVMVLANEYPQDDFDAIVRAVRQARTLDPDLEPATVGAVRATRRQLPERLRQIPANDLLGFSRAFGEPANAPNIRNPSGASRRAVRRREFADRLNPPPATNSTPVALNALPPAPDIYKTPDVPPVFATPAEHAVGFDQPRITPLNQLPDIKIPQQIRLQNMGIDSVEKLAETPPMMIARTAKISEADAQVWRDNARERVQNQQQTRQQALEAMQASQNTQAPQTSQPTQLSQTSQPTQLSQTSQPTQLSQTSQPTQLSQTSQPTQLSQTSQPTQLSQTSQPTQLSQTSQPTQLSQTSQPTQASQVSQNMQSSQIPTTAQASQRPANAQSSQIPTTAQASRIPTTAQASRIPTTAQVPQASRIPTTAQASRIPTTAQAPRSSQNVQPSQASPKTLAPQNTQASRIPTTAQVSQNAQASEPSQTVQAPQSMNFVSSSSDAEPPISVSDMVASSQQPPDEDANQDADGDAT